MTTTPRANATGRRRRLVLLLAALAAVPAFVLPAGTASASGLPATQTRVGVINPTVTQLVGVHDCISAGQRPVWGPSQLQVVSGHSVAAKGGEEAFHYTSREALDSIQAEGLRRGSYATRNGDLSPLQAQIDLALPPNRGLRDAVVRVDLAGLRRAGYEVPEFNRVGRKFNMPGGAYEVQFDYPIPPQFLKVVRP